MVESQLPNHIQEYLDNRGGSSDFIELFESKDSDFDLKTELTKKEIVVSNVIMLDSLILESLGIPEKDNIFAQSMKQYLRLRVSLDRKSRAEFVAINKSDHFEDSLSKFSDFSSLKKVKE